MASPFDACRRCAEHCPTGAIHIHERQIAGNEDRCVACGRCATVCPTEAITVSGFAGSVGDAIECARVPAADRVAGAMVVPCLGGLARHGLLETGESAPVLVDRGWCADCPAGREAAPWQASLDDADAARSWLGLPAVRVERRPLPRHRALPLPEHLNGRGALRRRLFRRWSEPPKTPERSPVRRLEPKAALRWVAAIERLAAGPPPAALLPSIEVSDACDASRVCVAACPTKALAVTSDAAGTGLDFDAGRCVACGVCAAACPQRAITVRARGAGDAAVRRALTRRAHARCEGCGAEGQPTEADGLCAVCRNEQDVARLGFALMRGPAPSTQPDQPSRGDAVTSH